MKKFSIILLLAMVTVICTTCDKGSTPTSGCGDSHEWYLNYTSNAGQAPWEDAGKWKSFVEGYNRVFQIATPVFENVCADEHIKLLFYTSLKSGSSRCIQARIRYGYSVFEGEVSESRQTGVDHDLFDSPDDTNFGIKQAFDEIPGYFWCYFEWILSDYLDYTVDLAYFKDKFTSAELKVTYFDYAPSSVK